MCSLQEHSARSYREEMAKRQTITPPTGELLPAEERLQNVLKAIEDRLLYETGEWRQMLKEYEEGWGISEEALAKQRNFISGLDIAWSLAKTESLRTDGSGPTVAPSSV